LQLFRRLIEEVKHQFIFDDAQNIDNHPKGRSARTLILTDLHLLIVIDEGVAPVLEPGRLGRERLIGNCKAIAKTS
jgi:hypothetical protein